MDNFNSNNIIVHAIGFSKRFRTYGCSKISLASNKRFCGHTRLDVGNTFCGLYILRFGCRRNDRLSMADAYRHGNLLVESVDGRQI